MGCVLAQVLGYSFATSHSALRDPLSLPPIPTTTLLLQNKQRNNPLSAPAKYIMYSTELRIKVKGWEWAAWSACK